jgi:hypothetical protein
MYPDRPTKKQRVDSLMHSSVDIDQMIVFEVNLVEDSIDKGVENNQMIKLALSKIRSYAQQNSNKVREARDLTRVME